MNLFIHIFHAIFLWKIPALPVFGVSYIIYLPADFVLMIFKPLFIYPDFLLTNTNI